MLYASAMVGLLTADEKARHPDLVVDQNLLLLHQFVERDKQAIHGGREGSSSTTVITSI
jgi:hypothetical protein